MDSEEVKGIADDAMDLGKKLQPSEMEIYIDEFTATSINIQNGRLSTTESNSDFGLGCRIAFGNHVGVGFTNRIERTAIQKLIENTAKTAKKLPADSEWCGLPTSSGTISTKNLYYPQLLDNSIEDLAEITRDLLTGCRVEGYQEPIIPIIGSTILVGGSTLIVNSHGIKAFNQVSFFYTYIGALAINNGKPGPMHLDLYLSRNKLIPDASAFASKIGSEAVTLASATKAKLSKEVLPVVFHPWALLAISTSIFFPSLKADNKQVGNSFLADRLGEKLVPSELRMYDDGTLPSCTNSSYYDQEGIARQKTPIFEDGIFKNFLYDHTTASKDGTQSTGNATRTDTTGVNPGDYANSPSVGISNWVIEAGKEDLETLISDIKLGILINSIQGAHQGSPESGDYTGVINPGYIIRDGVVAEPVVGLGIAGNILQLYGNFEAASNTPLPFLNSSAPHIKFREMRVIS